MALGPLALLLAWLNGRSRGSATPEIGVAGMAWLCSVAGLLVWSLFMFGPGTTLPHQGTHLPELFCLAGLSARLLGCAPMVGLRGRPGKRRRQPPALWRARALTGRSRGRAGCADRPSGDDAGGSGTRLLARDAGRPRGEARLMVEGGRRSAPRASRGRVSCHARPRGGIPS